MKGTSDQIKAGSDGSFLFLLSPMFFPLFSPHRLFSTVSLCFVLSENVLFVFFSTFQKEIEARSISLLVLMQIPLFFLIILPLWGGL